MTMKTSSAISKTILERDFLGWVRGGWRLFEGLPRPAPGRLLIAASSRGASNWNAPGSVNGTAAVNAWAIELFGSATWTAATANVRTIVQSTTGADLAALENALETFFISGSPRLVVAPANLPPPAPPNRGGWSEPLRQRALLALCGLAFPLVVADVIRALAPRT